MDKDFPCMTCNCAAYYHYTSIVPNVARDICANCVSNAAVVFEAYKRDKAIKEAVHNFNPDNLGYMEWKAKMAEVASGKAKK